MKRIQVLIVEDSQADALMVIRELETAGYGVTSQRVQTKPAMIEALETKEWDVILSDWSMPKFDALAALEVAKAKRPDLPFIIISGAVGEEIAVEALQAGAHDFMSKDRLARLVPALERQLRDAKTRRDRDRMERELLASKRHAAIGRLARGLASEMKEPLAGVLDDVARLAPLITSDSQEITMMLNRVSVALERMRSICEDLAMFSEVPSQRNDQQHLEEAVRLAVSLVGGMVRKRAELKVDVRDPPLVSVSIPGVARAVAELLLNTAQAIRGGTRGRIEIVVGRDGTGGAVIDMLDYGCGIPSDVLQEIFEPYLRSGLDRKSAGTGLFVATQIVESLGGELILRSSDQDGSVFRMRFPANASFVEPSIHRA